MSSCIHYVLWCSTRNVITQYVGKNPKTRHFIATYQQHDNMSANPGVKCWTLSLIFVPTSHFDNMLCYFDGKLRYNGKYWPPTNVSQTLWYCQKSIVWGHHDNKSVNNPTRSCIILFGIVLSVHGEVRGTKTSQWPYAISLLRPEWGYCK